MAMMDTYDSWKTSGPDECSHCGGEHSRRYCAVLKEEQAEAAEMKADEKRDEAYFKKMGWED
jgi:hypothetical protein